MNASPIINADPSQLPAWLNAGVLLIILPFFCGVIAAVSLRVVWNWAMLVAKLGSILCLALCLLGALDLRAASYHTLRLWMVLQDLYKTLGQQVLGLLMKYPVSTASLATGLCVGLLIGRQRWRSRRTLESCG